MSTVKSRFFWLLVFLLLVFSVFLYFLFFRYNLLSTEKIQNNQPTGVSGEIIEGSLTYSSEYNWLTLYCNLTSIRESAVDVYGFMIVTEATCLFNNEIELKIPLAYTAEGMSYVYGYLLDESALTTVVVEKLMDARGIKPGTEISVIIGSVGSIVRNPDPLPPIFSNFNYTEQEIEELKKGDIKSILDEKGYVFPLLINKY